MWIKKIFLTLCQSTIDDAFKDKKTNNRYKEEIQSEQYLERNLAMQPQIMLVRGGLQLS